LPACFGQSVVAGNPAGKDGRRSQAPFSDEPSRRAATSRTMEIDRIYKINRMRRKKINPVNLVNPVYFLRRKS
jgi:hypothetical protein